MAKTKLKLIHYTRAQFFLQEFSTAELQTELNAAMDKFGTVAKRSIVLKNGVTVESRFFRKRSRGT
ncbi:hypothetical protein C1Y27_31880, partial [Pseudomonas sp. GW704-F2]|uniref:hypothetical protein n=1 Tax=Pseudomonas sp. GW704-F2 TaxID=2070577 RepID=UPI000CBA2222